MLFVMSGEALERSVLPAAQHSLCESLGFQIEPSLRAMLVVTSGKALVSSVLPAA